MSIIAFPTTPATGGPTSSASTVQMAVDGLPALHPVAQFRVHYDAFAGPGGLARSSFNPVLMPEVLPWLAIYEPVFADHGALMDFRYRLHGTGLNQLEGAEHTGRLLSEALSSTYLQARRRDMDACLSSNRPVIRSSFIEKEGREFIEVYRGFFPVSTHGGKANQIFCVTARQDLRCRRPVRLGPPQMQTVEGSRQAL